MNVVFEAMFVVHVVKFAANGVMNVVFIGMNVVFEEMKIVFVEMNTVNEVQNIIFAMMQFFS